MALINEDMARQQQMDLRRAGARERFVTRAVREANDLRASGWRRRLRLFERRRAQRALRTVSGRGLGQLARLQQVPLFAGLSRRDLSLLARRADQISVAEGTILASEQHPSAQFMVITKGIAEGTVAGRRVCIMGPGDHFGELTLLEGEPLVPTVTALTDLEGFILARREFWGVLHAIPELSMRLAASVAEDLRRTQRRYEHAAPAQIA